MNPTLFVVAVILAVPQFGTSTTLGLSDRPLAREDPTLTQIYPCSVAGGIVYTVLTIRFEYPTDLCGTGSVIVAGVGSSVVCDIFITVTLTMALVRPIPTCDKVEP